MQADVFLVETLAKEIDMICFQANCGDDESGISYLHMLEN